MKTSIMRLSGALLCCAAVPVTAAKAQATQLRAFDLSAEPLPRALASFTRATGILVVADAALTRGKTSSAVKGRFSSEAALDVLLSGTGLRKTPDGRTGFVLVSDAPVLTPGTQSTAQVDTTPPEPEIIVYGRLARDTTRSIPQSIDVLDRDILRLPTSDRWARHCASCRARRATDRSSMPSATPI